MNELSLQDTQSITENFFNSGLFTDTKSKAQIFVKILAGQEMGLSPFAAMQSLDILQGRVFIKPYLMASLINKSPNYRYKVIEATDTRCSIEFYEIIDNKWQLLGSSTYTIEEAKRAGLVRPNSGYEKNPSDMLYARAMARGFRRYTPHLISMPVYVEGEEWFEKKTPQEAVAELPPVSPVAHIEQQNNNDNSSETTDNAVVESIPNIADNTDSPKIDARKKRIFKQTATFNGWTPAMLTEFLKTYGEKNPNGTVDDILENEYNHLTEGLKDKAVYKSMLTNMSNE